MAKKIYSSFVESKEGEAVLCKIRNFDLIIDEPEEEGGTNKGITPTEALLSAIGS